MSTIPAAMADPARADSFLEHRPMLAALAYRLLGSVHDADDVVQDAYLRWAAVDQDTITNRAAYLTTVTTRLALDRLRSARTRREVYTGPWLPEPLPTAHPGAAAPTDPAEAAALRDSASIGMLVLMEQLNPVERAVFVLREAFGLPYEEIAAIVERTPAHCRQVHHRAARHVSDARPAGRGPTRPADPRKSRALLDRFLAAAQGGDMDGLKAMLRDDVVYTTDGGGQVRAALRPILGAQKTSRVLCSVFATRHAGAVVTRTEYNHSPALRLTGPERAVVYVFETDSDGQVEYIYGILNPEKVPPPDAGDPRTITPRPARP